MEENKMIRITLFKSEFGEMTLEYMDEDNVRIVFYDSDNKTIDFLWAEDMHSFVQIVDEFNRHMEKGEEASEDESTIFTQFVSDVFGKNVVYNATVSEYVNLIKERGEYINRVGNHVIIFN